MIEGKVIEETAKGAVAIATEMPHISIKAEVVSHLLGVNITNSMIASAIVFLLTIFIALYFNQQSTQKRKGNFYYLIKFFIKSIYDLFRSVLGERTDVFFPLLFAFFFYILLQNWFGLLPGVGSLWIKVEGYKIPLLRGNTADLNTTLALAIISVFSIQFFAIKFLGIKKYLHKFFNLSSPIMFFVGILDILSEFSKILSFAFRLFGNIFAGEVLLTIVAFLVPVLASFPFIGLEIFVGFVQALVFSMLTAVFISNAVVEHG
ncbi:ATP synthase subunit a [Candidatus Roizmanbacteria bacterium]|nr:ATP synthase subunit a [Candidatus Roizmanbacteria bacterium]